MSIATIIIMSMDMSTSIAMITSIATITNTATIMSTAIAMSMAMDTIITAAWQTLPISWGIWMCRKR